MPLTAFLIPIQLLIVHPIGEAILPPIPIVKEFNGTKFTRLVVVLLNKLPLILQSQLVIVELSL